MMARGEISKNGTRWSFPLFRLVAMETTHFPADFHLHPAVLKLHCPPGLAVLSHSCCHPVHRRAGSLTALLFTSDSKILR